MARYLQPPSNVSNVRHWYGGVDGYFASFGRGFTPGMTIDRATSSEPRGTFELSYHKVPGTLRASELAQQELPTICGSLQTRGNPIPTVTQVDSMFLNEWPLWLSSFLLVGVTTLLSMLGPIAIRRRVSLQKLSTNNEVAGFKFATAGVLYAVLIAFAIIVVWERLSDAEANVAREAGAAATMYRLAKGIGGETETGLSNAVTHYLNAAIDHDWPAMEQGRGSSMATHALDDLYAELLKYNPTDRRGEVILSELLHQLDVVTEARRVRLVEASGSVPGIVWVVLFGGAIVIMGFTFFFGTANVRAQALMTGALALLIFSGLLIITVVDRPFAGAVKVGAEALSLVVKDFSG